MNIACEKAQQASKKDSKCAVDALLAGCKRKPTKQELERLYEAPVTVFNTWLEFVEQYGVDAYITDPANITYDDLVNVLFFVRKYSLIIRGQKIYFIHTGSKFGDYAVDVDEDWGNPRIVAEPEPSIKPVKKHEH